MAYTPRFEPVEIEKYRPTFEPVGPPTEEGFIANLWEGAKPWSSDTVPKSGTDRIARAAGLAGSLAFPGGAILRGVGLGAKALKVGGVTGKVTKFLTDRYTGGIGKTAKNIASDVPAFAAGGAASEALSQEDVGPVGQFAGGAAASTLVGMSPTVGGIKLLKKLAGDARGRTEAGTKGWIAEEIKNAGQSVPLGRAIAAKARINDISAGEAAAAGGGDPTTLLSAQKSMEAATKAQSAVRQHSNLRKAQDWVKGMYGEENAKLADLYFVKPSITEAFKALAKVDKVSSGQAIRAGVEKTKNAIKAQYNAKFAQSGADNIDVTEEALGAFAPAFADPNKANYFKTLLPNIFGQAKAVGKTQNKTIGIMEREFGPSPDGIIKPVNLADYRALMSKLAAEQRRLGALNTTESVTQYSYVRQAQAAIHDAWDNVIAPKYDPKYSGIISGWKKDYAEVFRRGPIEKLLRKDGSAAYRTPDEKVAESLFNRNNVQGWRTLMGMTNDNPNLTKAIQDSVRDNLARKFDIDGNISKAKFDSWVKDNLDLVDSMPVGMRGATLDMQSAIRGVLVRNAELAARESAVETTAFAHVVQNVTPGMVTPKDALATIMKSPALVRKLAENAKDIPGGKGALLRGIVDSVSPEKDLSKIATFFQDNMGSLQPLFASAKHQTDFRDGVMLLSGLQRSLKESLPGMTAEFGDQFKATLGLGAGSLASRWYNFQLGKVGLHFLIPELASRLWSVKTKNAVLDAAYRMLFDESTARTITRDISTGQSSPLATRIINRTIFNLGLVGLSE